MFGRKLWKSLYLGLLSEKQIPCEQPELQGCGVQSRTFPSQLLWQGFAEPSTARTAATSCNPALVSRGISWVRNGAQCPWLPGSLWWGALVCTMGLCAGFASLEIRPGPVPQGSAPVQNTGKSYLGEGELPFLWCDGSAASHLYFCAC